VVHAGCVAFEEFWIFVGDNASKGTIKSIGILSHLCNKVIKAMTIRLDLSFLSGDVRSIITNSEEIKSFSIDRSADADHTITTNRTSPTVVDQNHPKTIITLDCKKESLEDFKVILRNILTRNHLDNFTLAEDTEAENTVAILREGDLEQFGIYVCKHCGTTFKSIDERIIHERIHYFV
jgi:hypothetical protein